MKSLIALFVFISLAPLCHAQSAPSTEQIRVCEKRVTFYENAIRDYQGRLQKAKTNADRSTQEHNVKSAQESLKVEQERLAEAKKNYDLKMKDYLKKLKSQ